MKTIGILLVSQSYEEAGQKPWRSNLPWAYLSSPLTRRRIDFKGCVKGVGGHRGQGEKIRP